MARPRRELCVLTWRPHLQKGIDLLEKVPRGATPLIKEFKGVRYEERLTRLKLTCVETGRLQGDMKQVFKIMKVSVN